MKKSIKYNMLVVRAFPRYAEFRYYLEFGSLNILLIGASSKLHNKIRKEVPRNVRSIYRNLKPYLVFDPVKFIQGKITHRSWVVFSRIDRYIVSADIVNISDLYFFYGYHATRLAKRYGKKVIAVVWENRAHHIASRIPPYSFIVSYLARNVDLFVLRSQKGYEFTDSVGIPREKTFVCYKGIDITKFKPQKNWKEGKVRFLYVGQITSEKGVPELLKAFDDVSKEFDNIHLDVIGAGTLLLSLKEKYVNGSITFHGQLENDLTRPFYNRAHVFVSPSKSGKLGPFVLYEERFSYTLMEAQAAGCAVIATRCGGIPEEIGDENILVDQGDWEGIATAMRRLIKDREYTVKLGKYSRTRAVEHFDIRKQARLMEEKVLSLM